MKLTCKIKRSHKWKDKHGIIHEIKDPVLNQSGWTKVRCQRKGCSEIKHIQLNIRNKILIPENILTEIKALRK